MSAERIAEHQRARLLRALVELVTERGYGELTVRELVALAGVSRNVFYENFANKEECFWAAFEEIVAMAETRVRRAYSARQSLEESLGAALEELIETIVSEPVAAHFVFVDSLSLGGASATPRARAAAILERIVGEGLAEQGLSLGEPERKIRAVVGGIVNIAYLALREGQPERLRESSADLLEWGLGYLRAAERAQSARASAGQRLVAELGETPSGAQSGIPWEEPANSQRSREELSQRERILRGAAQACGRGYGTLSIPAISDAAGVSNQTFYEHFSSAHEAFLAAFEAMTQEVLETTAGAMLSREGWLEGGAAAIVTFMDCFEKRPLFREVAFFGLPAAGNEALDRAEQLLQAFTLFLAPAELPPEAKQRPPQVAIEAIAGGMWAVVQGEIVEGRADQLVELAPEIVDIVLIPFGVER
jgi:AcrR family transcriptional regulator